MDNLIVGCSCGYPHYAEFSYVDFDGEVEWFLTMVDCPTTFWERIKKLFKRDNHWREIVLDKEDINKIVQFLSQ